MVPPVEFAEIYNTVMANVGDNVHVVYFFAINPKPYTPHTVLASITVNGKTFQLVRIRMAYGMQFVLIHRDVRKWMLENFLHPVRPSDCALLQAINAGGFIAAALMTNGRFSSGLIGHDRPGGSRLLHPNRAE